jgi:hypothetical protein
MRKLRALLWRIRHALFGDPCCEQPRAHTVDWPVMAYHCGACRAWVCGWCSGAADDLPDLCDDCWCELHDGVCA